MSDAQALAGFLFWMALCALIGIWAGWKIGATIFLVWFGFSALQAAKGK